MLAVLALLAVVAGAIAAIAGFGIGSVLTPAMAYWYPAKLAVAAVSIPHLAATAYRLWLIREHVDLSNLRSFGAMSAAGGLTGAVASGATPGRLTFRSAGTRLCDGGTRKEQ